MSDAKNSPPGAVYFSTRDRKSGQHLGGRHLIGTSTSMPDGTVVHSMDRGKFEKAVQAAMAHRRQSGKS